MTEGSVGKSLLQGCGIRHQVLSWRRRETRSAFLHDPAHERIQVGIRNRLMHVLEPQAEPDVRERGMCAVEHPQLGCFERTHVSGELGAARFPFRARTGEAILDHPLTEALGHYSSTV